MSRLTTYKWVLSQSNKGVRLNGRLNESDLIAIVVALSIISSVLVSAQLIILTRDHDPHDVWSSNEDGEDPYYPDEEPYEPTTLRDIDESIEDASDWLGSAQHSNGGLKVWEGQDAPTISGTYWGIMGWLNTGSNFSDAHVSDAVDFIRSRKNANGSFFSDAWDTLVHETSLAMVSVHLSGHDIEDSRNWLLDQWDDVGGFGNSGADEIDAITALVLTGTSPFNGSVNDALDHLIDTYLDDADFKGKTDILSTMVLCGYSPDHPIVSEGIDHLFEDQNADGSWSNDTNSASKTAWVAWKLAYMGIRRTALEDAVDHVRNEQLSNGCWRSSTGSYSVLSTVRAIMAFTFHTMNTTCMHGNAYVHERLDVTIDPYSTEPNSSVWVHTLVTRAGNLTRTVLGPSGEVVFDDSISVYPTSTESIRVHLDEDLEQGMYHVRVVLHEGQMIGQSSFEIQE